MPFEDLRSFPPGNDEVRTLSQIAVTMVTIFTSNHGDSLQKNTMEAENSFRGGSLAAVSDSWAVTLRCCFFHLILSVTR